MSKTNGFTLLEEIFVLSLILTLSFLTLPIYRFQVKENIDNVKYHISAIINGAKTAALSSHEKVNLYFTEDQVYYSQDDNFISYSLPDNYSFSHLKEVYFNENGNINQANHVLLHDFDTERKLIFHLGNGDYYFEE